MPPVCALAPHFPRQTRRGAETVKSPRPALYPEAALPEGAPPLTDESDATEGKARGAEKATEDGHHGQRG